MTGRPCKPGSDLHGLWRLLLSGTAFPACGVAEEAEAATRLPPETEGDGEAPLDTYERLAAQILDEVIGLAEKR
jgi:hypothetical protein